MNRSCAIFTVGLALTACSDTEVVSIDLPAPEDMHTMLVGVEYDNSLRVYAYDLDADNFDGLPTINQFEGAVKLYAMFYRRPLGELRLAAGELRAESDKNESAPLADFDLAYRRNVVDSEPTGEWAPIGTSGAAFAFRVSKPPASVTHCPESFATVVHELDTTERFFAAATLSDDEVLGFGRASMVVRVTPEGVEQVDTSSTPPDVFSAVVAANGNVWLGLGDGRIVRGHPERGFEVMFERTGDAIQWIDGPPNPTEGNEELFVMTADGEFIHYDGTRWISIFEYQVRGRTDLFGDALWVGKNRGVAFPPASVTYATYDDGDFSDTFTEFTVFGVFAGLTRTGDGKVALMTTQGIMLQATEAGLLHSVDHSWADDVFSMGAYLDGFFYARYGLVPVYGELGKTECVGKSSGYPNHIAMRVQPMGSRMVVFGAVNTMHDLGPDPSNVTIVEAIR